MLTTIHWQYTASPQTPFLHHNGALGHETFKTSELRTFKSPSEWNYFLSITIIYYCPPPPHLLEGFQELYLLGAPAQRMFSGTVSAWCSCSTYVFHTLHPSLLGLFSVSVRWMALRAHTSPEKPWQPFVALMYTLSEDRDRPVSCTTKIWFPARKEIFLFTMSRSSMEHTQPLT